MKFWDLIVVGALVLLLFGSRKLPDMARSLGKSMRIFRSEMRAARRDRPVADGESRTLTAVPVDPAEDSGEATGR